MTTTQTQTMLAWAQTAYGGPDAVAAARVDVPAPRAGPSSCAWTRRA